MSTIIKTLILQNKTTGKKRVVKIRERNNLPEALQACYSIAKHSRMPIKQIRYK